MEAKEPSAEYTVRTPAPQDAIKRARELVRAHPECFWFREPDAEIRFEDDVRLVAQRLREYGDKQTWNLAQELLKCL